MNHKTPLVSVIMPVYNAARFVKLAVESILRQTMGDFEFLIINDGSTDETPEILQWIDDPRVRLIINEENLGLVTSLNRGLCLARGRYIARQDADDISLPARLERQVEFMEKAPTTALLGTNCAVIDEAGNIIDSIHFPTTNAEIQQRLPHGCCILHATVLMRRDCLENVGGYRQELYPAEDYDLWLRLAERFEVANLPESLYQMRIVHSSISAANVDRQLAYHRLARELAKRRQQTGHMLPGDEIAALPLPQPEPELIRSRYAHLAAWYYLSDTPAQAKEALLEVSRRCLSLPDNEQYWADWAVAYAHRAARRHGDVGAGVRFLEWACLTSQVEGSHLLPDRRRLKAHFHWDCALLACQEKRCFSSVRNLLRALLLDRRWLRNRGTWGILVRSLGLRRRAQCAAYRSKPSARYK